MEGKTMKWIRLALAAVICIASLAWVGRPAWAQSSPPPAPEGASIVPGSNPTNVRLEAEVVNYSIASTSLANVKAIYQMRNLGDFPEQMDVRFPLYAYDGHPLAQPPEEIRFPPLENFTALVDGMPASVYTTQAQVLQPQGDKNELKEASIPVWANFPVTFPSGKVVKITVEYIQRGFAGYMGGGFYSYYGNILYSAAGWKGTIGSADINIILPVPADDLSVSYVEPESATITGYTVGQLAF